MSGVRALQPSDPPRIAGYELSGGHDQTVRMWNLSTG
jgi:hypothetical protein